MGFRRPFAIKITGIPPAVAPANWTRYDSVADLVYVSLGAGRWKTYAYNNEDVFVKWGSGGLLSNGAGTTLVYTRHYIKAAAGSASLSGHAASLKV
jgi:hypothetical protein